jgi:hypothetical protein
MSGLRTPPCQRQENTSEVERQSNIPMSFGGVDREGCAARSSHDGTLYSGRAKRSCLYRTGTPPVAPHWLVIRPSNSFPSRHAGGRLGSARSLRSLSRAMHPEHGKISATA